MKGSVGWGCRMLLCAGALAVTAWGGALPVADAETTLPWAGTAAAQTETLLDLGDSQVTDLEAFQNWLDEEPGLTQVDMYETELTNVEMATLSARYPQITFGWTLHIGDHTLRTDATAFSTLHSRTSKPHTSEDFAVLAYCKNLLALDLGHNAITDIRFLETLSQLRILILGRNSITDTTPLGSLRDLEYLELFSDHVTDVSALAHCERLMDLNLSNNGIADLSPVLSLPNLQRLWLYRSTGVLHKDRFPDDTKAQILAAVPSGCTVNLTSLGTGGGWRDHPRYDVIREIFQTGVYRPWE